MIGSSTGHCADSALLILPSFAAALLSAITVGCTPNPSPLGTPAVYVNHLPPTKADIIEAVIRSHDVSLNVHWSCYSVGDLDDRTMGRYIGRLISFVMQGETNWVEVTLVPRRAPAGMYWRATAMFHLALDSEDPFNYGVQFLVRQRDGLVIASSFSCPGV